MLYAEKHVSFRMRYDLLLLVLHLRQSTLRSVFCVKKKKRSEYLSSGEIGRGCIVSLAKETEGYDSRAARVLQLTAPEQGIIKYHASSCYRSFQRDMAKTASITRPLKHSEPPQQAQGLPTDTSERRCKRFKPSKTTSVCVFCGANCKTVKQKNTQTLPNL